MKLGLGSRNLVLRVLLRNTPPGVNFMITLQENSSNPHQDSLPLLWAMPRLISHLQISRSQIYQLIQDGEFPKPLKLGRSSRWIQSDIKKWIEHQVSIRSLKNQE
jgi:prophage regulatory protein